MVDVLGRARELVAEIVLRARTGEGADAATADFRRVGDAAEETNKTVEKTTRINASAERAYAQLQRRLAPLEALQERFERGQRDIRRALEQGVIGQNAAQRSLARLQDEYEAGAAKISQYEKATVGSAEAASESARAYERQRGGLARLGAEVVQALGNFAAFGAAFVSLKVAQLETMDGSRKMSLALALLGRVLPIAAIAAATLAFIKLGVEGVKAVNAVIDSSLRLARVQREAEGQVSAAISSTGGAARRSIEDIRALAGELQDLSNIGDEVTTRAAAQLLTFTNIRGENFDRTLRIGNDVAARLQRDPEQVALQLGKALNDPVRNLGALTESGIQFSEGQRNLIKSLAEVGEIATAQTIILAELENQFKGAAAAQREAEGGATALANAWGDVKEALGDRIIERTADATNALASAVADPVWPGFARVIGDIVGGFKAFGVSVRAAAVQVSADFVRGIGIIVENIASAQRAIANLDLSAPFRAAGAGIQQFTKPVADFFQNIKNSYDKLPPVLRDLIAGGPALGSERAVLGIGRRERERRNDERDQNAEIRRDSTGLEESLPKIIEHYESLTKESKKYFDVVQAGGSEALETLQHQEALTKTIAEVTAGLPAGVAARVEEEIRAKDAIDRQTDALVRLEKQAKDTAPELEKLFDPAGDLAFDNARLQTLIDAAALGREELDAAEQRFEIEDAIARIKLDAARASKSLSDDEIADLEQKLALNADLQDRLARATRGLGAANDNGPARFATDLGRELDFVADDFVTRLVREGRLGFREMGRDLKDILLNAVLDPFRNALANALRGLFGGFGGGVFTPGFGGGASPAGFGAGFGAGGIFSSFGSFAGAAAPIAGLALGGPAAVFGVGSLLSQTGLLGQGVAGIGNFLGLAGGTTDFLAEGLSNAFNPANAFGGIAGSLLSSAVFGKSTAASIGSTIGGIAGSFIPVPFLGSAIGSFIGGGIGSLFAGKPSNKVGQVVFDPETGAILGTGQDRGGEQNLEIARAISQGVSDGVSRLLQLTGGTLTGAPINVEVGSRDGIRVGFQGAGGLIANPQRFDNSEAGITQTENAALKLAIGQISGGDETLTAVVRQLTAANEPLEKVIERTEKLAAALDVADKQTDVFKQRLEQVIEAFAGLDRSTGALKNAFDQAIDGLAARANDENRDALEAILNPLAAEVRDQLEALTDRRAALEDINAAGGNVDLTLFDDLARRQLLARFNLEQRLAQGADPARASVDQFNENQRRELEALTRLVGQFGVTMEDVAALQRAQVFERRAFLQSLPEEDRLRLSGQGDAFLDLSSQYEAGVDRFLEEAQRLVDGFETEAQRLSDVAARERAGALDIERAIAELDRRFGQGNPAERVDILRARVEDLRSRALVAEDSEDRRFARDELPRAVQDLVERAQSAGASSPLAQNALSFGRAVLVEVGESRRRDAETAERSLAVLEEVRDGVNAMRDILASPTLDAEALAARALALPDDFAGRDQLIDMAARILDLQAAIAGQNEAITAALEALAPEDVGLVPSGFAAINDNTAPLAFTASDATAQSGPAPTATAGGAAGGEDGDLLTGLYFVAKQLQEMRKENGAYYKADIDITRRSDAKLGAIAQAS